MGLLYDAAQAWQSLSTVTYKITIGKAKKSYELCVNFHASDFYHVSGFHYAKDVDFKMNRSELSGEKLLRKILNKRLDSLLIEKSSEWKRISKRLKTVIEIEDILDHKHHIYSFDPKKLDFYSKIQAAYVIKSDRTSKMVFLFIDSDSKDTYFCRSVFIDEIRDYSKNQTSWTVLKKVKYKDGIEDILYQHSNFQPKRPIVVFIAQ